MDKCHRKHQAVVTTVLCLRASAKAGANDFDTLAARMALLMGGSPAVGRRILAGRPVRNVVVELASEALSGIEDCFAAESAYDADDAERRTDLAMCALADVCAAHVEDSAPRLFEEAEAFLGDLADGIRSDESRLVEVAFVTNYEIPF